MASWQLCTDHNTTSARLSTLGATPAAQVSGGQTPPSANQDTRHCQSSAASPPHLPHLPAVLRLPGSVHRLAKETQRKMTAQRCPCQLLVFKETLSTSVPGTVLRHSFQETVPGMVLTFLVRGSFVVLILRRHHFQHALVAVCKLRSVGASTTNSNCTTCHGVTATYEGRNVDESFKTLGTFFTRLTSNKKMSSVAKAMLFFPGYNNSPLPNPLRNTAAHESQVAVPSQAPVSSAPAI